jgi:trk system potassium uptake protein TrkH
VIIVVSSKKKKKLNTSIKPTFIILMSFVIVIAIGGILLMMPFSSSDGKFTSPVTALFTSVSATCVTGLTVVDTGSYFNLFGQLTILLMIQIGGLGLVTFASFINFLLHRRLELHTMKIATESVSSSGFSDVKTIVTGIVKFALFTEVMGTLLLCVAFVPRYGIQGVYLSLFLAISSFCNAGFDVTSMFESGGISLIPYTDDPYVLIVVSMLIIIGGLGYFVWNDISHYRTKKKFSFMSKVVLLTEAILLVFGAVFYIIGEWDNASTIGQFSYGDRIVNGIFLSVTMRTAGLINLNPHNLTNGSKMLSILYMFIGCASGSTGGGIKTTTFAIIVMTMVCVVRGKTETIMFGRRIDKDSVYKSMTIMVLGLFVVAITSLILLNTNPSNSFSALECTFESASAFGTAGVPSGLTETLTLPSVIALSFSMLIGRVGPVTFVASLSIKNAKETKNEIIPEARIMVG